MKRRASAKQKAWRKKFAAKYGRKGKVVQSSQKVISKRKVYKTMARRRRSYSKRSFKRTGGSIGRIFKTAAIGIGGADIAKSVATMVFPQAAPIASLAGGWLTGGTTGAVSAVVYDLLKGQGNILGGLFGGLGGQNQNVVTEAV